jgi:hypothetical protein
MVNLGAVEATLGENLTKWLLRLVVTLVIAAVWDYCCRPPPPPVAKTQTPPNSSTANTTVSDGSTRSNTLPAKSRLLHDLDFDVLDELVLEETVEHVVKEKQVAVKEEVIIPATEKQESHPPPKETEASSSDSNSKSSKEDKSQEKSRSADPVVSPAVSSPALQRQPNPPSCPVFRATTDDHPGLRAFWNWCNVETSLFRIYTVSRTDHVPVVPPYNPSSRRGQVSVHLRVTNGTDMTIAVYWVNYKGREERKGNVRPGAVWTQTTWMEHPWVLREAVPIGDVGTTDEQQVLLHYIPYTILPTLPESPTVDPEDPTVGMHQFTIRPLDTTTATNPYIVSIDDPTLPFPAEHYFKTPTACISWTLMHCRRMMEAQLLDPGMYTTLIKYLTKIVQHPEVAKYRQIRIANPVFHRLWQTPIRGLLLAVGFVECGAYLELGSSASSGSDSSPLRRDRVQDVALLLFQVEQSRLLTLTGNTNTAVTRQQPLGADGFGRAGWGRAGGMNVPDS